MYTILRNSFQAWKRDNAAQLGAATAYYAVFSLAPFLVLVIAVSSLLIDAAVVQGEIESQLRSIFGEAATDAIHAIILSSQQSSKTGLAALLSVFILFLGASGLMIALQNAMNSIWRVELSPHNHALVRILFKRFFSIGMVLAIGFLFLVSLIVTAGVSFAVTFFTDLVPLLKIGIPLLNMIVSFSFVTLLLAVLYKFLPDIRIRWRDVFPGALVAALLFSIGKFAFGYYLGHRDVTSTYGVAGTIILLLLWVNYSSQILYFGAEFVREYVLQHGSPVRPREYARFIHTSDATIVSRKSTTVLMKAGVISRFLLFEGGTLWSLWKLLRRLRKR